MWKPFKMGVERQRKSFYRFGQKKSKIESRPKSKKFFVYLPDRESGRNLNFENNGHERFQFLSFQFSALIAIALDNMTSRERVFFYTIFLFSPFDLWILSEQLLTKPLESNPESVCVSAIRSQFIMRIPEGESRISKVWKHFPVKYFSSFSSLFKVSSIPIDLRTRKC